MEVTEVDYINFRSNIRISLMKPIKEEEILKKLVKFVSVLHVHVNTWTATVREMSGPLRGVMSLAEQLRSVEQAKIEHMDDFISVQDSLVANILNTVEEELVLVKNLVERLVSSTNDYKSALCNLEKSTEFLDFTSSKSDLVIGHATQPPLSTILQDGLKILILYSTALDEIAKCMKNLDFRDEVNMNNFKNALEADFIEKRVVTMLLATTQYFDKKNIIT